ncbi:AMP dependent ligase/synthetase, putative [Ixodes scapularis]|uniref:AMP dependent ligase/synthetase, putative n=1 Tax=Ixodes scapularis TaxID=6945 RepID=B7QNZ5_IXOSC|nr:AMP dependent ligase/synthetase, putative [Ixodes scapularis]|eukprot:XP_002416650.1 AMP dependent ligase/synthetase, putative [Ixodes scapularis]
MVTARIEDGIVYSPFPEHPPAEISMFEAVRRCLIKHGDKTALVSLKDCHKFQKIKEEMNLKSIFVVGKSEGCTSTSEFATLNEEEFQEVPLTDVKKELAALTYTSGTTGISKVVEATQYSFVTALEPSRLDITFDESEIIATWGQLTFTFGVRYFLSIVCSGSTAVVLSRDTPVQEMVDTLRKHEVTTLSGPVVVLQQLIKELQRTSARLDSVTKVEACGVLLSKQATREILSAFNLKELRNPYGATEGCGIICTTLKNRIACDTIGFPVPMTQIKHFYILKACDTVAGTGH